MKKIFTLLAVSAAFSASALTIGSANPVLNVEPQQSRFQVVTPDLNLMLPGKNLDIQRIRKAAGVINSVEGTWTFILGDFYRGPEESYGEMMVDFVATLEENNQLYFEDPYSIYYPFNATYNAAENTLTFIRELLGSVNGYYIYQTPFTINTTTNTVQYLDEWVVTFDPVEGTLDLEENSGIAWIAYRDKEGTRPFGTAEMYDFVAASKRAADSNAGWTDLGNATFTDGWLSPGWEINQFQTEYEVPLQQNNANPNLYRLVNPYLVGPMRVYNLSKTGGYLTFDISNPDFVLIQKCDVGFADPENGYTRFLLYNMFGYYVERYPDYTPAQIISLQGDYMPHTTYENGVVRLNYRTYQSNGSPRREYDANFGTQFHPGGSYGWYTEAGEPINMTAKIVFPGADGVEAIGSDDANAPLEYFTLQGVRIDNPEAGQLVIKRQGGKAQKVIVR